MEGAFLWVMVIAVAAGVIVCFVILFSGGSGYDSIGRGSFGLDGHEQGQQRGPAPGSAAALREADDEIRQMLEAKNARRERRGEAPLDVEEELAALTSPGGGGGGSNTDPALREEVRQLVVARNERRARQGKPPLDVEAEIDRQLRELGA